jgi:hypothetical protein
LPDLFYFSKKKREAIIDESDFSGTKKSREGREEIDLIQPSETLKSVPNNLETVKLVSEIHKTEELVPEDKKPFKLVPENPNKDELVPVDDKKVQLVPENLETEDSKFKTTHSSNRTEISKQDEMKTSQLENVEKENVQPTVRDFITN